MQPGRLRWPYEAMQALYWLPKLSQELQGLALPYQQKRGDWGHLDAWSCKQLGTMYDSCISVAMMTFDFPKVPMLVGGFRIPCKSCGSLHSFAQLIVAQGSQGHGGCNSGNTGNVRWENLVGGGKEVWWNLWRRCRRR